jgi:hypothetical protein
MRLQDSSVSHIILISITFIDTYIYKPPQSPTALWELCAWVSVPGKQIYNFSKS